MNRQSNIELLRIIAMFMILGLHVNFIAIGVPEIQVISNMPLQGFARLFTENMCIVGVNVFVLISGWFGIHFKTKGICSFIFQCLFFSLIVFIAFAATGQVEINRINIMSAFLLYKNAYWFVWAYLFLYILAPVLNGFIDNANRGTVKRVIILFFAIQTITFIFTSTGFTKTGYSPLSFIGLYLLARYYRLHRQNNCKYIYLGIYLLCALCNTLIYFIPAYLGQENNTIFSISISYTNPLNIIGALSLLLFFTKIDIISKLINWVASSCFAVYLFHCHFCLAEYYTNYAKEIFNNFSGVTYFAITIAFILGVFVISVLIDKIRNICFNFMWNNYEKTKTSNDRS